MVVTATPSSLFKKMSSIQRHLGNTLFHLFDEIRLNSLRIRASVLSASQLADDNKASKSFI